MFNESKLLYKKAYTELYEIIINLPFEEKEKIPKIFKDNLKSNLDDKYIFKYDRTKGIDEQNILNETKALFVQMYIRYLAPKEEEEAWKKYTRICFDRINQEKRKKYNENDLFKKKSGN